MATSLLVHVGSMQRFLKQPRSATIRPKHVRVSTSLPSQVRPTAAVDMISNCGSTSCGDTVYVTGLLFQMADLKSEMLDLIFGRTRVNLETPRRLSWEIND